MNIARFFEHWSITENPFRAEEARHDSVFARLDASEASHPDFEKILGEVGRPDTSIVFGEKGSGKTAIRMQLEARVREHNDRRPDARVLLLPYDDLNGVLDAFVGGFDKRDARDPLEAMKKLRLVDHLDGVLHVAVSGLVDAVLGRSGGEGAIDFGAPPQELAARLRRAPRDVRRDVVALQAVYDRPAGRLERGQRLRRALRVRPGLGAALWPTLAAVGWVPAAAWFVYAQFFAGREVATRPETQWILYALAGVWALALLKWLAIDLGWRALRVRRLAKRVAGQLRTVRPSVRVAAKSLSTLRDDELEPTALPVTGDDEGRLAMVGRLRNALRALNFDGVMVVLDRIDEPTLVRGDADRMRAVIWPMMNNKFLQMEGFGFKFLLPIELRHLLFRESSAFFQEARLDKQNMIEQLSWTGATLYDLCNARLQACRPESAEPVALVDLFEEDVSRGDVVDALDQMRQPRDAFKLIYQCVQDHCANVTEESTAWRIPRHVLENARRRQADRVQQLFRGMRPA